MFLDGSDFLGEAEEIPQPKRQIRDGSRRAPV